MRRGHRGDDVSGLGRAVPIPVRKRRVERERVAGTQVELLSADVRLELSVEPYSALLM